MSKMTPIDHCRGCAIPTGDGFYCHPLRRLVEPEGVDKDCPLPDVPDVDKLLVQLQETKDKLAKAIEIMATMGDCPLDFVPNGIRYCPPESIGKGTIGCRDCIVKYFGEDRG